MNVITVDNMGKKYIIGHQRQRGYHTLRDTLAHTMRGIMQRVRHPLLPNREEIDLEEFWALKDINLVVKEGERVGIIGPNGAGKTTLLKLLSRITDPTTGRIYIKGRVSSLLEVGTGFHPELTGRENIFLNGAVLGMKRHEIKNKFDAIVSFAEVEKFLDTPVKRFSSGMYVRLAFAVAAHLEPEILLIDEVLAVGDTQFQSKCLGKMGEVAKEGRTILFVSHNMSAIQQLCERVILLNHGTIKTIGEPTEVINDYLSSAQHIYGSDTPLSEVQRIRKFGTRVRFIHGWSLDIQGNKTSQYTVGAPIKIHLELTAQDKDYDQLYINIGINSIQQVRIATETTRTNYGYVSCKKGQTIAIEAQFNDLVLSPGRYDFTVIAGDKSFPLDVVKDVLPFDVIEAGQEHVVFHPPMAGIIRTQVTWEVVKG